MALSGNSNEWSYDEYDQWGGVIPHAWSDSHQPFSYLFTTFSWSGEQSIEGNYTDVKLKISIHTDEIYKSASSSNYFTIQCFGITKNVVRKKICRLQEFMNTKSLYESTITTTELKVAISELIGLVIRFGTVVKISRLYNAAKDQ